MRACFFFFGVVASALALAGCRSLPDRSVEERRAAIEAEIDRQAVGLAPAIDSARERVAAAVAGEDGEVALDSVELRTALVHAQGDKARILARLPLRSPFELAEQHKVRRAETEIALAELEEATLAERVARCLPSLEKLSQAERERLFASYRERHLGLLDWSRELERAGRINEAAAAQFDLETRVKLATQQPIARPEPAGSNEMDRVFDVLPELDVTAALLQSEPELLRDQVVRHQPRVAVHRARREQLEALARRETMKRMPSPRFVDLGFEPVAYAGAKRQISARVSFDIPFGRAASAGNRRYRALARSEQSAETQSVRLLEREAAEALTLVNDFRARMSHWLELQKLADESEAVAERLLQSGVSEPDEVSRLTDSVYEARLAVLEARERAGRAECAVVEATGTTVAEWPSRSDRVVR